MAGVLPYATNWSSGTSFRAMLEQISASKVVVGRLVEPAIPVMVKVVMVSLIVCSRITEPSGVWLL